MMAIYLIISAILIVQFGCAKHIDRVDAFHIIGRVIDKTTERPIEGVQVSFRDTGFDSIRSQDPIKGTIKIGDSKVDGYFDISFQYWWGNEDTFYRKPPKQTFDLIFNKPDYASKHISYDLRVHYRKNEMAEVDVGDVVMESVR